MNIAQKKSFGPNRATIGRKAAKPNGVVSHYPLSSVLVVFGLGLGVGVALASILGGPTTAIPSFRRRAELAAENLGRQMRGAIVGILPESVSKHIAS
jgi:hypothetical protein